MSLLCKLGTAGKVRKLGKLGTAGKVRKLGKQTGDSGQSSQTRETGDSAQSSQTREVVTPAEVVTLERLKKMNLKECADEIKRRDIRTVADKYLTHARKSGYICPDCNNGTGESGTGAEVYHNHHNREEIKCHVCGKNWNTLELIAQCENLNLDDKKEFVKAVKIGCELFGLSLDENYNTIAPKSHYKDNQSARKIEETPPPEYERLAEARKFADFIQRP